MTINWLRCDKELPCDDEKVLIIYDNEIQTAIFEKGITEEERGKMEKGEIPNTVEYGWCLSQGLVSNKRSDIIKSCDKFGNNLVPYCWNVGGHRLFGQEVDYWAHFPNIKKYKKEN